MKQREAAGEDPNLWREKKRCEGLRQGEMRCEHEVAWEDGRSGPWEQRRESGTWWPTHRPMVGKARGRQADGNGSGAAARSSVGRLVSGGGPCSCLPLRLSP